MIKNCIKVLSVVVLGLTFTSGEAYCSARGRTQPKSQGVLDSLKSGLKRITSDSGARVKVHAGTSAYRGGRR